MPIKHKKDKKQQDSQPNAPKLISKAEISNMNLIEITQLVEQQSQIVIQNPEENINHLHAITNLMEHESTFVVQMAMCAITEIFVDIVPMEKIDVNAHQQAMEKMLKKEERQIIQFEMKLIELYQRFVQDLCLLSKVQTNQAIQKTAITCLSKLLQRLYHFNFARQVCQHVVYAIVNKNQDIQELAFQSLSHLLEQRQHNISDIKIQILSFISKVFQQRKEEELPDWLIQLANHVQIDSKILKQDIDREEQERRKKLKDKKKEYYSQKDKMKKEKQDLKQKLQLQKKLLDEVKKETKEAQADEDRKQIARQNAEILEKLFYLYFKVLKHQRLSKFYLDALDGILKYVHLINVDLIWSLIDVLIQCCSVQKLFQNKLTFQKVINNRLQTVYTLQKIINGPGQVFEIDDKQTVKALYQVLLDINNKKNISPENERTLIDVVQQAFLFKRQFSQEVVGSFIKELLNLPMQSEPFAYSILFLVKSLMIKYGKTNKMIEEDNEGYGLNQYNRRIDDPSSTNAINSSIFSELNALKLKFEKSQRLQSMIQKIIKIEPLPQHLVAKKPLEVYEQ